MKMRFEYFVLLYFVLDVYWGIGIDFVGVVSLTAQHFINIHILKRVKRDKNLIYCDDKRRQ